MSCIVRDRDAGTHPHTAQVEGSSNNHIRLSFLLCQYGKSESVSLFALLAFAQATTKSRHASNCLARVSSTTCSLYTHQHTPVRTTTTCAVHAHKSHTLTNMHVREERRKVPQLWRSKRSTTTACPCCSRHGCLVFWWRSA